MIPLTSARKEVIEHDGHLSPSTGEGDRDNDSAADVNDAAGSGIDEMDHIDIGSKLHGVADSGRDLALGSLSVQRKLPLLVTGSSVKSNSAPQHRCKCRRHRISAPVPEPSDGELDTGDETSGSVYMPRGSSRGRCPPRPSHLPQRGAS
jgi:hypothetical protein